MFDKDTRILVIDDEDLARVSMRKILKELGYDNVDESIDGDEALYTIKEAHKKSPYQIVFSDWMMPKMSGMELLEILKNDEELKDLMVIFVSSQKEQSLILEAIGKGVDSYVVKPADPEKIKNRLDYLWSRANLKVPVTF